MLSLLYQEGPSTKGIFRRSGSAKTFKELKEKLDSGTEVDLARESIFVTASLFKVYEEYSCLPFLGESSTDPVHNQGRLFSRKMPKEDLVEWINKNELAH